VLLQDVDTIIAESAETAAEWGLKLDDLREVVLRDMLMRPPPAVADPVSRGH
jgi:hypothetical protein